MSFAPKKILVPLAVEQEDELALARDAVDAACDMAQAFGAELLFMHAAPPPVPIVGPDLSGETYRALRGVLEARVADAEQRLGEFEKQAAARGLRSSVIVRSDPDGVAQVVCHVAESEGADLIVLSSHGRKGVKRLLLGSAAERVAHLSHVPVMLLKH
jgi:nucleotide-binding universal stress UspA family protein